MTDFEEAQTVGEQLSKVKSRLREIREETARLVWVLTDQGYTVRDIAPILRISPGRVSQIKKEHPRP